MSWPAPPPTPPRAARRIRRLRLLRVLFAVVGVVSVHVIFSRFDRPSGAFVLLMVVSLTVGRVLDRRERRWRQSGSDEDAGAAGQA